MYNNCFTFYKYGHTKEFAKRSFDLEFKGKLELFYHDTIEIKPNNEYQIKDLEKRKVIIARASELYYKFASIYIKLSIIILQKQRRKG